MSKKFYAVKKGRIPGIYNSWEECKKQIYKVKDVEYKSFLNYDDAQKYIDKTNCHKEISFPYLLVMYDGGARGNPGIGGCGSLVYKINPNKNKLLYKGWKYLGEKVTNNIAEYNGCLLGLNAILKLNINLPILVKGDSTLVTKQMNNEWDIKDEKLKVLWKNINSTLDKLNITTYFEFIPRKENSDADFLANKAMDSKTEGEEWSVILNQ